MVEIYLDRWVIPGLNAFYLRDPGRVADLLDVAFASIRCRLESPQPCIFSNVDSKTGGDVAVRPAPSQSAKGL